MKNLKLTLGIMTVMLSLTLSAWADGVSISNKSTDGEIPSNVPSTEGVLISNNDGEIPSNVPSIWNAFLELFKSS